MPDDMLNDELKAGKGFVVHLGVVKEALEGG